MKIKVLHVIDGLGASGGAERQLALNLRFLDKENFEHHVVRIWPKDALESEIKELGIPVYSLNSKSSHDWFRGIWGLIKLIRKHKIDVIHTSLFQSEMMGGVAGRLTGRPVLGSLVTSSYGPEWLVDSPELSSWKLRTVRIVRSMILKTCYSHMMAITEAAKESAVKYLAIPSSKISIVHRSLGPNWTDRDATVFEKHQIQDLRAALGASTAAPFIVTVGRLTPAKGHRYLLEAMVILRKQFPDIKLVIAGLNKLGPRMDELRTELGLEDCVEFLGVRTDIRELLAAADICVYPSIYEGFGNAVIEAAAMAKPMVVTRIPPYLEILGEGATTLKVDPGSVSQIVDSVSSLANDPARATEMGESARAHVIERFKVSVSVGKLASLYRQLHLKGRKAIELVATD